MEKNYSIGIDVGSTTVKYSILDENDNVLETHYERHYSKVRETVINQLRQIGREFEGTFQIAMTGSAGLGLAEQAEILFVQEVHAASIGIKAIYPDCDVAIELGGEDAKILFLTGSIEQRMNGSCAGGTGAFIDQMATLMAVTPDELDELALRYKKLYPIASRCGVFAKSDIQPLLNQGVSKEDIAASIYQAVVHQTISGLAQGRKIEGKVLFLGGPLHFMRGLRDAFRRSLHLTDETGICPEMALCFVAFGAALSAQRLGNRVDLQSVIDTLVRLPVSNSIVKGRRLFVSSSEYDEFVCAHNEHNLKRCDLEKYTGKTYLGIDAGSTTIKLVLIGENNELLYDFYTTSDGKPLNVVAEKLKDIYDRMGKHASIEGSCVAGYGEDLLKEGLGLDEGIVETVAHFKAASYFCPEVDFIIDIGGQDIKCFRIKNGAIDSIMLNEACSSGCGSFIQAFASAMGYSIADFARLGLFAKNPVDLGSRCTVFMNSSVKQAQKDGASPEDISAGLSASIVKNAVYKVIRARSVTELGEHIVVQGGTFLNDAVLRAFEQELGRNVVRPPIAGLMGAFGCALYAKERKFDKAHSKLLTREELERFNFTSLGATCHGCTAGCSLTIIKFDDGRKFISGNKCEKGAGRSQSEDLPNLYPMIRKRLQADFPLPKLAVRSQKRIRVGLPLALGFYEQLPYWRAVFGELGFEVVVSVESTREMYEHAQHTIPSDTVCYPAKLMHGHILNLLEQGVDFIFYPCESYNIDEGGSDNHYNCPLVAYYPELLKANVSGLTDQNFIHPYLDLNRSKHVANELSRALNQYGVHHSEVIRAVKAGETAYKQYLLDIKRDGQVVIEKARRQGKPIIVLCGRPYHIDPEVNHCIDKLINSLGLAVVTETAVSDFTITPKLQVLNQWSYHSRLYQAAQYVATQQDMQFVQLVSFGCGIDAITTDEVRRILESQGKLYTALKIDEITNLGAIRIRLRSLLATIR